MDFNPLTDFKETVYAVPPPFDISLSLAQEVIGSALRKSPLGEVAIYIHVPFCINLCQFCGFVKEKLSSNDQIYFFVQLLRQEIQLVSSRLQTSIAVSAIYFGGGTASLLSAADVGSILDLLSQNFTLKASCELSFEGEAQTLLKKGFLEDLRALGFCRISFGVQVWDDGYRHLLNLRTSRDQLQLAANKSTKLFDEVACDYIYGLPGTDETFLIADLQGFLSLDCNVVEAFQFERIDASPFFIEALIKNGIIPLSFNEQAKQHNIATEIFSRKNICRYSFSLFNHRNHNPKVEYYSSYYGWGGRSVLGFGRGSQSFYNGVMWGNNLSPKEHEQCISKNLFPSTSIAEYSLFGKELITWPRRGEIEYRTVSKYSDADYQEKLSKLIDAKYVEKGTTAYFVAEHAWSLVPLMLQTLLPDTFTERFLEIFQAREQRLTTYL